MASFTLSNTPFPNGTSVGVYDATGYSSFPAGGPPGKAVATASVSAGKLTFSGLTNHRPYFAAAKIGEAWKSWKFTPGEDAPPPRIPDDIDYSGIAPNKTLVVNPEGTGFTFEHGEGEPVKASRYGMKFTGEDETEEFANGLQESMELGVALELPAGRTVISSSQTLESLTLAPWVRGQGSGLTKIEHDAHNLPLFNPRGTGLTAVTTITAPVAIGDNEIEVASTSGLQVDDLLLLRDSTNGIEGEEIDEEDVEGGSKKVVAALAGEYARVRKVVSATKLQLSIITNWAYAEGSDVRLCNYMNRPTFEGFSIVGEIGRNSSAAARGILNTYVRNLRCRDLGFEYLDGAGIYLNWVNGYDIGKPDFLDMREDTTNGYGIVAGRASAHGSVWGLSSRGGRHAFTTTGSDDEVAPQLGTIRGALVTESQFTAYDTHPGSRFFNFVDCQVHNNGYNEGEGAGFQIRGPDTHVINPIINGAVTGVGFVDGADRGLVQGGVIRNCAKGIRINDSDQITVDGGVRIENPREYGIHSETASEAWTGHMVKQNINDCTITGEPSEWAIAQSGEQGGMTVDTNRVDVSAVAVAKRFSQFVTLKATAPEEQQWAARRFNGEEVAIRETIPRLSIASDALTAPASKALNFFGIYLRKGDVINKINFTSGSTALSEATHQLAGIYSYATKPLRLAQSADLTNTAWADRTSQTFTLSAPYTVPASGRYYLGLLVVAATPPNLSGSAMPAELAARIPRLNGISTTAIEALPTEAAELTSRIGLAYAWVA